MLRREAADGVRSLQGGRLLAPNEYVITLSAPDYEKVVADPDLTSDTFAKHLGGIISGNRGGKRMVMWSSDSSSHRICTPARSERTVSSIPMPPPPPPPSTQ